MDMGIVWCRCCWRSDAGTGRAVIDVRLTGLVVKAPILLTLGRRNSLKQLVVIDMIRQLVLSCVVAIKVMKRHTGGFGRGVNRLGFIADG